MGGLVIFMLLAGIVSAISGSSIRGRKKRAKASGAVAVIGGGLRATYYISSAIWIIPLVVGAIGVGAFWLVQMIPVG